MWVNTCTSPVDSVGYSKITIIPEVECKSILRGIPLPNHHLGWPLLRSLLFAQIYIYTHEVKCREHFEAISIMVRVKGVFAFRKDMLTNRLLGSLEWQGLLRFAEVRHLHLVEVFTAWHSTLTSRHVVFFQKDPLKFGYVEKKTCLKQVSKSRSGR